MRRRLITYFTVAAMILSMPLLAGAASFRTFPTKLILGPKDKAQTLKVVNEGTKNITVQITAYQWSQGPDGEDELVPTRDLVFYPRTFEFEGGEEQTIKAGFEKKRADTEKTFRLIIEEIPTEAIGKETSALRMVLRMSVPVFVKSPTKSKFSGEIKEATFAGEKLSIRVNNDGKEHFFVRNIKAEGKDDLGKTVLSNSRNGWYVLAGASRVFEMGIPAGTCSELSTLETEVETDGEGLTRTFSADAIQCSD